MQRSLYQYFRNANWENPRYARWLFVLAGLMLPLVALGFFLYDGWHRVAYMAAFSLIALANVCLALGSLLPSERSRRLARLASHTLSWLMIVALFVTLLFQFGIVR